MKYFNFLFYLNIISFFVLNTKEEDYKNDSESFYFKKFLEYKGNSLNVDNLKSSKIDVNDINVTNSIISKDLTLSGNFNINSNNIYFKNLDCLKTYDYSILGIDSNNKLVKVDCFKDKNFRSGTPLLLEDGLVLSVSDASSIILSLVGSNLQTGNYININNGTIDLFKIDLNGNIFSNGKLIGFTGLEMTSGDIKTKGNIFGNSLNINTDSVINGKLTGLTGLEMISGDIKTVGNIFGNSINLTSGINVNSDSVINGKLTGLTGLEMTSGDMKTNGNITGNSINLTSGINANSDSVINGKLTGLTGLEMTSGDIKTNGNISGNSINLTSGINVNSDSVINGKLTGLTGLEIKSGDLTVSGKISANSINLKSGININSNAVLNGKLTGLKGLEMESGDIKTTGNISANSISLNSGISVNGDSCINGKLSGLTCIDMRSGNIFINGNISADSLNLRTGLNIVGDSIISGKLIGLTGLQLLSGDILTKGAIVANSLNISKKVDLIGDINIGGEKSNVNIKGLSNLNTRFYIDNNGIEIYAKNKINISSSYISNDGPLYVKTNIGGAPYVYLTTTNPNASSIKYKKDIENILSSKEQFKKLRPVSFKYKDADESIKYGLIAEELFEINDFKNLVVLKNNLPESIDYNGFIPIIIKNINDINLEIDELRVDIDKKIENKVEILLEKLSNLLLRIEKIENKIN